LHSLVCICVLLLHQRWHGVELPDEFQDTLYHVDAAGLRCVMKNRLALV